MLPDLDNDKTMPPQRALRFDRPAVLYREMPEVAHFTKSRPEASEDSFTFLDRLRGSTTPEDAVTFIAFAIEPRLAIQWGVTCVKDVSAYMADEERQLLAWIDGWLENPTPQNRWRILQVALFNGTRSPAVYLGLAVGWSGGPYAPNDPVRLPPWRAPRAVNSAVLRALGQVGLENRSVALARILDLASNYLRHP
ncbi:MAG: DUF6931 family protein [Shimia sp.]